MQTAIKPTLRDRLPVRDDVETLTYYRQPTPFELRQGYGAIHYRDFSIQEACHPNTRIPKRYFVADDGLRYYRPGHSSPRKEPKPMTEVRKPTLEELQAWTEEANKFMQDYLINEYDHQKANPDFLTLEPGKKYARIVKNVAGGGRSSWAFLNMENGDVLKSETWNKPAKHARGNIFTHKPADCCNWTGPHYLK